MDRRKALSKRKLSSACCGCLQYEADQQDLRDQSGDQLLIRAAKGFREITDSVQIFRITGNCFLAVLDSLTDYEKARDGIEEFLKKPFFIENEKVSFHRIEMQK